PVLWHRERDRRRVAAGVVVRGGGVVVADRAHGGAPQLTMSVPYSVSLFWHPCPVVKSGICSQFPFASSALNESHTFVLSRHIWTMPSCADTLDAPVSRIVHFTSCPTPKSAVKRPS